MKKSVYEQFEGKTVKEVYKAISGKELEIIANTSGHNYGGGGHKFKAKKVSSSSTSIISYNTGISNLSDDNTHRNTIHLNEISLALPLTKEELEIQIGTKLEEISKMHEEVSTLKDKIKFIESNDLKEFDEEEFKVFQVLSTIEEDKLSKMEKAHAIAKLVRGC